MTNNTNIKIKTTRDRTMLWMELVCGDRLIHVLCVARGVIFDIQNLRLVIQHKTSNFLYGNTILLYCMCSFQFLQGIYIRNLYKKRTLLLVKKMYMYFD